MNKDLADDLQKSLGISHEQIVREEYEMLILKRLFESEIGKAFVFKGGTALRLAYGSHRFSDDLDFSTIQKFNKRKLKSLLGAIADHYAPVTLVAALQKHYTYFALYRIKENFTPQAFSIKFKASVRPVDWKKDKDYKLATLTSEITSLTVLVQVATLERIKKEKQSIERRRIRDVYDLWFIGNLLKDPVPMDFSGWSPKKVRRELHKYLPLKTRRLLDEWL